MTSGLINALVDLLSPRFTITDRLCWLEGIEKGCDVVKWGGDHMVRLKFSPLFCRQMTGLLQPADT